jgi:hypothetical protein
MKEQFKTIRPNLGANNGDPVLNLEPPLSEIIYGYYKQYFQPAEAKRLTEQYIEKWVEQSFKESFW